MNLILPIITTALIIGLFSKKITWREWLILSLVIIVTIVRYYYKEG